MKRAVSIVCLIAVLFSGILSNMAFASELGTPNVKASFEASGAGISVRIGTLDTMKGGSFVICYNPSVVRFETMTVEWWSVGVKELEEGKIQVSFEDVVNSGTGLNAFYSTAMIFEWIGPGTPGFSVEDVIVYDKEGTSVLVEKEERFSNFYVSAPDWEYNEEMKILTVRGTGFLLKEFIDENTWDFCREEAKYIILEDGITGMGYHYFLNFSALEKITVPPSVKSLKENSFFEDDRPLGKPDKFVIEGEAMTEAERFATACQYPFKPVNSVLLGDIDQDNSLTPDDALAILKMDVKMTDCYGYTADVDENGEVNAEDALCVLKSTVGIEWKSEHR